MQVKTNSLKAWILAARPKTLTGAVAPVLVGAVFGFCLLCYGDTDWKRCIIPATLCLLFAILMQIDANFINDYFDFKKGSDTKERLGPERACAQGWITPLAMKTGIAITTVLAFVTGLPLIWYGGWITLAVGLICILGAFLYTTRLSYIGLGDFLVVLFFGLVPVFFTFHVIIWHGGDFASLKTATQWEGAIITYLFFGWMPLFAGLGVGLVTNNLLIINNYRDREQDAAVEKNTLVVRLGAKTAEWLYLINGIIGEVILFLVCSCWKSGLLTGLYSEAEIESMPKTFPFHLLAGILFLPFLFSAHRKMVRINHGRELNSVLGETARNILIYSILFVVSIIIVTLQVCYSR